MKGHQLYEDWLKSGQVTPMDGELKHHVDNCLECLKDYQSIMEIKATFDAVSAPLSKSSTQRIRMSLQAESQRRSDQPPDPARRFRWWWLIPLTGALASLLLGVLWLKGRSTSIESSGISRGPSFEVFATKGARWHYLSRGHSTVIAVEEGSVDFSVSSLTSGQNFHVISGTDWVEVRGTKFSVTVAGNQLMKVTVSEGVVALHAVGTHRLILSGMSWNRSRSHNPSDPPQKLAAISVKTPPLNTPPAIPLTKKPALVSGKNTPRSLTPPLKIPGQYPLSPKAPAAMGKKPPIPLAKPVPPVTTKQPPQMEPQNSISAHFAQAYRTLQSGNWREAVGLFQSMLNIQGLGSVRPDVLFWLSQAHLRGGQYGQARARLEQFLRAYPKSWRSRDAQKQLKLLKTMK
ncbi:tetratricopeptide repeat protein [Myxococcota bacterium]|nr:tetratricopeptide repeat protein [Myxococcota bacterium]MBU1535572.1 tetratricopeptide repeat protein [Myxococcota bacterium]